MRLILGALLVAVTCQAAWAQDGDMPDFAFASQEPLETDMFDSKQHNKWKRSSHFVQGIKAMNTALDSDDENVIEHYDQAIASFNKEISKHPRNGYALCNMALCQYHMIDIALNKFLVDLLNNAAEHNDGDSEEFLAKLDSVYQDATHDRESNIAEAIATLERGMELLPVLDRQSRCDARIVMSEMLKSIDADQSEQLKWLHDAVVLHPCEKSYLELLNFYSDNNYRDEVARVAQEAAAYIPNNPIVRYYQAVTCAHNGDYAQALAITNDLLGDNPTNKELLQLRTSISMLTKNYKAALADVITMANNDIISDAIEPLVDIAKLSGDTPMVIDAVRKQATTDSEANTVSWWLIEATLQSQLMHDWDKAIDCAKQELIASNYHNSIAMQLIAEQYYLKGDLDKALALLDKAATMLDLTAEALTRKIEIEMHCGMASEAINDAMVLKNMGIDTLLPLCYSSLGWANSALGDWTGAIAHYETWQHLEEDNIMPRYYRARALVLKGQVDEGRDELEQILATTSFDGNEELKMNVLYYLGRTDESLTILRKLTANTELVAAMTDEQKAETETLHEVMSAYNLACAWSLHGDSSLALNWLKRHFDGDSNDAINYNYALLDYDFDNIRNNPQFLNIINEYKNRWLNGNYQPAK